MDAPADDVIVEPGRNHARRNGWLAFGSVVLGALAAWWLTSGATSGGTQARPTATVGTAKATLADMPVTLSAIGTVQPVTSATVRSQESGTLFAIYFTEGQMVGKGQLLARIDGRPYQLALTQAEANLARDAAQLSAARIDLARYQTLLAQDSIAHQQVDTQSALVKQLDATIAADRAAIGTARLNLQYTTITAPVSGRIGLRQADLGNYLTPSDATGIAVITVTQPIDISFAIPQDQIGPLQKRLALHLAIPVTAKDQTSTQAIAEGSFLTFDNAVDTASGTVKAKARFTNAVGKLFPNQFVNVELLADTLPQAVTVPVGAVRHGPRGDFVFELLPNQTVRLRLVKTGPSNGQAVAILSGINAGTTVVSEGADGLDDGSKVSLPGHRAAGTGGRYRRQA